MVKSEDKFRELGFTITLHDKMPDVVLYSDVADTHQRDRRNDNRRNRRKNICYRFSEFQDI